MLFSPPRVVGAFKSAVTPSIHREMIHSYHLREARRLFLAIVEGGDCATRERTAQRFRKLEQASPRATARLRKWLKSREQSLSVEQIPDTDDGF